MEGLEKDRRQPYGIKCKTIKAEGRSIYAVGGRNPQKAAAFAEKYGIEKAYGSLDELFEDKAVEAVYIATPHNTHYEYIKRALESGKHVLAEKAITLNSRELEEAAALAEENDHMAYAAV